MGEAQERDETGPQRKRDSTAGRMSSKRGETRTLLISHQVKRAGRDSITGRVGGKRQGDSLDSVYLHRKLKKGQRKRGILRSPREQSTRECWMLGVGK